MYAIYAHRLEQVLAAKWARGASGNATSSACSPLVSATAAPLKIGKPSRPAVKLPARQSQATMLHLIRQRTDVT
jgi:hypothetical protein